MRAGTAALQVVGDMAMVSALVYETGLQDSYFVSLYLLVIIVGSILFSRAVAFGVADAASVFLLGGHDDAGLRRQDSRTYVAALHRGKLRFWFLNNCSDFWRSPIWRACWRNPCGARGLSSRRSAKSCSTCRTSPKTSFTPCAAA